MRFRSSRPSISLYDNIQHGNSLIANLGDGHTGKLQGWWRQIRRKGGWWLAGGEMKPPLAPRGELLEIFTEGMCRRVGESVGKTKLWAGFIAEMELTLDGVQYVRSIFPVANAVKSVYSRIGDNLFSDGSAETAAWTEVGSTLDHERSTSHVHHGTYSMYVHTDGGGEGTEIERGLAIVAGRAYECEVSVYIESGTWALYIYNQSDDSVIVEQSSINTGDDTLSVTITEDNTYSGNVYVRILNTDAGYGKEIYADDAKFRWVPYRTETQWYTDDDSISEYGRIEDVVVEGTLTDDAAAALAQTDLGRRAWPRSLPPGKVSIGGTKRGSKKDDKLEITFAGYAWTLNWRHLLTGGTDTASNHVTALVGESELITAGVIETNALSYQVEQSDPMRLWDAIEAIIDAGDGTGARWAGGVYAGRTFNYEAVNTSVEYYYRGGQLFSVHSGMIEPWFVLPALARIDDLPVGPGPLTGDAKDDPRNVYIEQVEYSAPDGLRIWREKTELD